MPGVFFFALKRSGITYTAITAAMLPKKIQLLYGISMSHATILQITLVCQTTFTRHSSCTCYNVPKVDSLAGRKLGMVPVTFDRFFSLQVTFNMTRNIDEECFINVSVM